jgi:hypothetical protein
VGKALQTQLLSWEDEADDRILLAGIPIFLVSAPATRAIVARTRNLKNLDEASLDFALPHDLQFVDAINDVICGMKNANLGEAESSGK